MEFPASQPHRPANEIEPFCAIAASVIGISSFSDFVTYTAQGWLYKTVIEVALLPITYRVIAYIKNREPSYQPVTV